MWSYGSPDVTKQPNEFAIGFLTLASSQSFVLNTIPPSEETLSRYNLVSIPVIEGFVGYLGYITRQGEELPPLAHEYLASLRERLEIE